MLLAPRHLVTVVTALARVVKPLPVGNATVPISRRDSGPTYCGDIADPTIFTHGDIDNGGPGVLLRDVDYTNLEQQHYYFLYENGRDNHPWKYTLLTPGSAIFLSVCPTFSGRLVRGNPQYNLDGTSTHNLGTWVEVAWDGPPSRAAWGDVSLLEGFDGAAAVAATDGTGALVGFSADLFEGAPVTAVVNKTSGGCALAKTVGPLGSDDARA